MRLVATTVLRTKIVNQIKTCFTLGLYFPKRLAGQQVQTKTLLFNDVQYTVLMPTAATRYLLFRDLP